MKRILVCLSLFLTTSLSADVGSLTQVLLENATEKTTHAKLSPADSLYPHYLVYGFEVSKSAGVGEVLEIGGAFGAEFHFEKVEAP